MSKLIKYYCQICKTHYEFSIASLKGHYWTHDIIEFGVNMFNDPVGLEIRKRDGSIVFISDPLKSIIIPRR